MKNERVTITKLAGLLGVSPSTVSRALQNHPSIGKETCKKVQKLAVRLGYFPNSIAANLRRKKTNFIGVIVPRIDRHFHSYAISGMEEVANKAGYYVGIFQSNDSYQRETENVKVLLSNRADGVIACLALETNQYDHFLKLKENNTPLVFFDRVCYEIESSRILIDDFDAAFKVCEHLISMGCTRIAHIAGNQNSSIFRNRLEGYKAALKKNQIEVDHELICYANDLDREEGWTFAGQLLHREKRPDGLFCANDVTAVSAIQYAKKENLKIPEELAVAGFSNTPASMIIEPALTTIDDHAFEMGQAAARLLIRQIERYDEHIASETVFIRNDLIIRKSTLRK
ncbi:LacI family DNA-binding transcriptional regulator [Gaoshiqia sp. Z1-71]|uniref:LacI family DNA-binding transcriptional regulator n=1 Tax=Gaoshiqia hydrogeniformans TaxID=3290090 RepID=UPI003BF8F3DE